MRAHTRTCSATCSIGSRRRAYSTDDYDSLLDYTRSGASPWTGSDTQLATKSSGLVHLIVGSGAYQFV